MNHENTAIEHNEIKESDEETHNYDVNCDCGCCKIRKTFDEILIMYNKYLNKEATFDDTWWEIKELISPLQYPEDDNMLMMYCYDSELLGMIVICVACSDFLPIKSRVLALTPEGLKDYYKIDAENADYWLEIFEETFYWETG